MAHTTAFYILLLTLSMALLASSSTSESKEKKSSILRKKAAASAKSDMDTSHSIAAPNYKKAESMTARSQSVSKRYGYPYLIAPTLPPFLQHRADTDDNEDSYSKSVSPLHLVKSYGSRLSSDDIPLKKSYTKKLKVSAAERRQGYDDDETSAERRLRIYREPTYRNFHELESIFRPRRIDPSMGFGYSSKLSKRPELSPRDPFLSPSAGHADIFYPSSHKYKRPYGSGGRIGYGAGAYDSPGGYDSPPSSHGIYDSPPPSSHSSYDSPPPSSYDDYDSPPPSSHGSYGGHHSSYGGSLPSKYPSSAYDYNESYSIESNKPIVGDIRKRLLDFAGASDLYEGEPDYLREVGRNKHKYGSIGNNYYPYGAPENSFRDFHYAESKLKESLRTR